MARRSEKRESHESEVESVRLETIVVVFSVFEKSGAVCMQRIQG